MTVESSNLNTVNNVELVGAGGRYEKKVIKTDFALDSGHRESSRIEEDDDMEW